jgi:RNA polymerase nonessential primary-like sigma factor
MGIEKRDSVGIFLKEIKRYPLLSQKQEVELARHIVQAKKVETLLKSLKDRTAVAERLSITPQELESILHKGKSAQDNLTCHNLRLVVSIAKTYINNGLPFSDLIQEGTLGLIRATETFDPEKGIKFSTYSYMWIKQAVTRAIANYSRTVRLPCHIFEKLAKIRQSQRVIKEKLGRNPTMKEIAQYSHIEIKELLFLQECEQLPLSLNHKVGKEKDTEMMDLLPSDIHDAFDSIEASLIQESINAFLESALSEKQKKIIELRFGLSGCEPYTLAEIGDVVGNSKRQVKSTHDTAIKRLRANPNINQIKSLVP